MHCSSCGKAVNQNLSYCKHCGAKISRSNDEGKLSEASLNFILAGILGLPIAGIGVLIGLMSVMKKEIGFGNEIILPFVLLGFLLLMSAEGVFIWLLINRTRLSKETKDNMQLKAVVTKELSERQVRELAEPGPSVTENTTRSLDPVRSETTTQ